MIKNFLIAAMVGLGVAGAIFAIQNSAQSLAVQTQNTEQNNLVSNKPFIEQLKSRGLSGNLLLTAESSQENVTKNFTKNLVKNIQEENPTGPTTDINGKGLNVPSPDQIALDLIIKAQSSFDPSKLKPAIKDNDLNISQDNSRDSLINYLKNLYKIMGDSGKLLTGDPAEKEMDMEEVNQFISMYEMAYKNLFPVNVPSSLLSIHKKELQLLGAKWATYTAIKNYEQDPLLAILVAQNLNQLDNEFADLNKEIKDFDDSH